jgi:hypothetical protein
MVSVLLDPMRRTRWTPGPQWQIDRSHPLAPAWAAIPGVSLRDSQGQLGTTTTGFSGYAATKFGRGFTTSTASTGGIQWPVPPDFRPTKAISFLVLASVDALDASNNILIIIRDNATDVAPFLTAGVYEPSAGGGADVNFSIRDQGGTFSEIRTGGGLITNGLQTGLGTKVYGAVLDAANNSAIGYKDGTRFGSSTWPGGVTGISWSATPPGICLFGFGTNTTVQGIQGSCALGAVWGRALTAADMAALYADPFCWAIDRSPTSYFFLSPQVGGGAAMFASLGRHINNPLKIGGRIRPSG